MTVYVISYDLQDPGQDYEDLFESIKSYPGWSHILESTWLVSTDSSAGDVRDQLKVELDSNDRLLVAQVPDSGGGRWATTFTDEHTDWLHDTL